MPRLKLITIPWELEVPTLGLASLAAVTPARFEISIVDLLRERLVLDEPVDLVGITASTPRIKAAYALAELYRQLGVTVVLGGHHVTAMPERRCATATRWCAARVRPRGSGSATTSSAIRRGCTGSTAMTRPTWAPCPSRAST